jgi:hypothetical protein
MATYLFCKPFFKNFLPPIIGFVACAAVWLSLPKLTFMIGGTWLAIGIIFLAVRTKGFREKYEVKDIF